MQLTLPFPPSANRIWRSVCIRGKPRVLLSRQGREFRETVAATLAGKLPPTAMGRLAVSIDAYPPDRRRRDLDNLQKAILDSLQAAGVYLDDAQIDVLQIRRCPPEPGGKVVVHLEPTNVCPSTILSNGRRTTASPALSQST